MVRGASCVGGLVGCYRGEHYYLDTVIGCFWDIQAWGLNTSDGGTGKTTAEMQLARTFLDARWDFVGETGNGTTDIWWIDEGKDYPLLAWEIAEKWDEEGGLVAGSYWAAGALTAPVVPERVCWG
jgi:hypothetical protein